LKREIYKNLGISATNNESLLKIYTNSDGINLAGITAVCLKYTNLLFLFLLLQSALQPLVGFRPAQLSLSILSRKVLQSAVASGTSNPKLGGEPEI
jgi:hypothetical protein